MNKMETSNILVFGTFPSFCEKNTTGKHIPIDGQFQYCDISSGDNHIVIVTSVGTSYSFGDNKFLQLGIDDNIEFCDKFTPVALQDRVLSVKCGNTFSIWRTTSNSFYLAGRCLNSAPIKLFEDFQLIDAHNNSFCALLNDTTLKFYSNYSQNDDSVEVMLPAKPQEIACSINYALALAEGSVFKVNQKGELTCIFSFVTNIVSIKCSDTYVLALDASGTVHMSGSLPNMKRSVEESPIISNVKAFFALPRQCFFETENFKLICIGHNENGQLADGTTKRRVKTPPTVISGVTKGITGNGMFTAIIDSPFDESLLKINYKQLTPGDLSYPLEMSEDLFSYKE